MKAHSTLFRTRRSLAKVEALTNSPPDCQADDGRTVKFTSPQRSRTVDRVAAEDYDNENTVSFSKQPGRKKPAKAPVSLEETPRKQPKFTMPSANEHLIFSAETRCEETNKPKQQLCRTHAHLVEIMKKIDSYLLFLRSNRSKANDLFTSIQKNLNDNYGLMVRLDNIWKILYLLPQTYNLVKEKGSLTDFRISLPTGPADLEKRADNLKTAILEYVEKAHQQGIQVLVSDKSQDKEEFFVDIPCASMESLKLPSYLDGLKRPAPVETDALETEVKLDNIDTRLFKSQKSKEISTDARALNPYAILDANKRKQFREKLMSIVKEKERKLNEEKERLAAEIEKSKRPCLTVKDYEYFLESLTLLYVQRHVNNMFVASVVDQMTRRINYTTAEVTEMLEQLQAKGDGYLRTLTTVKGKILQMDKSKVPAVAALVASQGFL